MSNDRCPRCGSDQIQVTGLRQGMNKTGRITCLACGFQVEHNDYNDAVAEWRNAKRRPEAITIKA